MIELMNIIGSNGLSRMDCVKRNVVLTTKWQSTSPVITTVILAQTTLAYLFFFTVDLDVVETLSTLPGTLAPEVIA